MIKRILMSLTFILPLALTAQVQERAVRSETRINLQENSFDAYCKKEALTLIDIASEKKGTVEFSGTLDFISEEATYLDYGIELKKEKGQYFKLNNSDKVLAVKSLFVLKLNYSNSNK